ncbi:MAG: hypothetical protein IPN33_01100 [Saprospiraceae bacterium]|nr:hypothetical protein [Saprospiraceae bacterium]
MENSRLSNPENGRNNSAAAQISWKVWFELASSSFVLGLTLMIVCMINHFHALSILSAVFVLYFLVAGILSLRMKREIHVFFYVSEVFKILFSFCAVVVTGGILKSGGLVMIGMAGIFFALVFPKPEKAWFLLLLYLGTLTAETLLQPYLTPLVEFSPSQNLIIFVLTLSALVLSLFSFFRTFLKSGRNSDKRKPKNYGNSTRPKAIFSPTYLTNSEHR